MARADGVNAPLSPDAGLSLASWRARIATLDRVLVALVMLALVKCLLWSVAIDPWRVPDEPAHFGYVQWLAREHSVPLSESTFYYPDELASMSRTNFLGIWGYSETKIPPQRVEDNTAAGHPPLYYTVLLPFYLASSHASVETQLFVERFATGLLFLALIWVSYRFAQLIFPRARYMHIGVPLLLIFHPQLGFTLAGVENDSLLVLLFTAFLWQLTVFAKKDGGRGRAALIGLLMGLGMLTKSSFAPAYLAALAVLAVLFLRGRHRRRRLLETGALMLGIPVLIAGWYYLRNYLVLGYLQPPGKDENYGAASLWQLWTATRFRADLVASFLGNFSWLNIPLPGWVLTVFRRVAELAAVGVIATAAIDFARRRRQQLAPWLVLLFGGTLAVFFLAASWFEYTIGGAQGRYLFPAVFPFWSLFLLGLTGWMPARWRPRAAAVIVSVAGAFFIWSLMSQFIPRMV